MFWGALRNPYGGCFGHFSVKSEQWGRACRTSFLWILHSREANMLQPTRCAAIISRHGRIQYCNRSTESLSKTSSRQLKVAFGTRSETFFLNILKPRARTSRLWSMPKSGTCKKQLESSRRSLQKRVVRPCRGAGDASALEFELQVYVDIYIYIQWHIYNNISI